MTAASHPRAASARRGGGATAADPVDRAGAGTTPAAAPTATLAPVPGAGQQPTGETGGPSGPEPTRYGDWEKGGRCFDF